MICGSWYINCNRHCFCHLGPFLPFTPPHPPPPNSLKNENFKKLKKALGDIFILHKCIRTHDHMLSYSWDMVCDNRNYWYFSFWAIFCLFIPLKVWKIKIYKNDKKKHLEISSSQVYQKSWSDAVPKIWCIFFILGNFLTFLPFLTPLTTQKMKISEKWKNCLEISSFNTSVPKIMIICFTVPEIWRVTDAIVIFQFGLFLALWPLALVLFGPLTAWKIKISKKIKKHMEISSL